MPGIVAFSSKDTFFNEPGLRVLYQNRQESNSPAAIAAWPSNSQGFVVNEHHKHCTGISETVMVHLIGLIIFKKISLFGSEYICDCYLLNSKDDRK